MLTSSIIIQESMWQTTPFDYLRLWVKYIPELKTLDLRIFVEIFTSMVEAAAFDPDSILWSGLKTSVACTIMTLRLYEESHGDIIAQDQASEMCKAVAGTLLDLSGLESVRIFHNERICSKVH